MEYNKVQETDKFLFYHIAGKAFLEDEDERNRVVNDLANGMPDINIRPYFSEETGIVQRYHNVLCAFEKETKQYVGIIASRWVENGERPILSIITEFVINRLQGSPVFIELSWKHINEARSKVDIGYITLTTCHPTVYRTLVVLSNKEGVLFYPDMQTDNREHELASEAKEIVKIVYPDANFDEKTGVLIDDMLDFPFEFYTEFPQGKYQELNETFDKIIENKNVLFCMAKLR